jgi:NAD(P) transhydrogenase subunit alpha
VVEVSDVRYSAKEQVQSLGGKFIEVEGMADLETAGGYAREASAEILERQRQVVRQHLVNADVIITTALVPGRPAPRLVSADVVRDMRSGSVIVDLAVDQGGNCELSEPGAVVVKHGVTLIGRKILAASVPVHASEMYAKNVLAVLLDVVKKSELRLDLEDEVVSGALVVHERQIRNPALAEFLHPTAPAVG